MNCMIKNLVKHEIIKENDVLLKVYSTTLRMMDVRLSWKVDGKIEKIAEDLSNATFSRRCVFMIKDFFDREVKMIRMILEKFLIDEIREESYFS